jgi:hypothetical protein
VALLNPNPALPLPVTMWTLARLFVAGKSLPAEELLAMACPPALRKAANGQRLPDESAPASNQSVAALRALQDLGMVRASDGRLTWSGPVPCRYSDFCHQLRNAVFSAEYLKGVEVRTDAGGSKDLLRALAWFLTKDPTGRPWSWQEVFQDPSAGSDDETRVFVNSTRWNGFIYWVDALGLGEVDVVFADNSAALTPDPTRAIRDTIFDLYGKGHEIPVPRLLDDLRERLPVLAGGPVSQALHWPAPAEFLDPATSYALEAGDLRGWLRLESRADAQDPVLLADLNGTGKHRTVSHVVVEVLEDV